MSEDIQTRQISAKTTVSKYSTSALLFRQGDQVVTLSAEELLEAFLFLRMDEVKTTEKTSNDQINR
jgi:hypothetical protein